LTGGLVFVELSDRYLAEIGTRPTGADSDSVRRWPRLSFLAQSRRLSTRADGSRYVVLDRVLPVRSNQGDAMYTEEIDGPLLLLSLNGVAVRSLSHLKRMMLEHLEGGRDLAFGLEGGKLIVLDGEKLAAADEEVRARYAIPYLQANLD
jgi:hypothetical protein